MISPENNNVFYKVSISWPLLDDVTISEKNEKCEFVFFIMYAFILLMIHRNANEVHIFNEIFLKRESFCGRLGLLFALESK